MRRLDASHERLEHIVEAVAAVVLNGGIVIFPTDTVYGIGCDPHRLDAVARIYDVKNRARNKPLALHLGSRDEALEYVGANPIAARAARRFLPGPLAIIVERPAFIDGMVTAGLESLSLRVPRHALCSAILDRSGPLAATSANLSGRPAFIGGSFDDLPDADLLIDAGPTPIGIESTVLDFTQQPPLLIRWGAIGRDTLEAELGSIRVNAEGP
ncbi:MAG: L-threonylcarbamoyladenylate synthase [Vulcanimicrobiaceae bacterium]